MRGDDSSFAAWLAFSTRFKRICVTSVGFASASSISSSITSSKSTSARAARVTMLRSARTRGTMGTACRAGAERPESSRTVVITASMRASETVVSFNAATTSSFDGRTPAAERALRAALTTAGTSPGAATRILSRRRAASRRWGTSPIMVSSPRRRIARGVPSSCPSPAATRPMDARCACKSSCRERLATCRRVAWLSRTLATAPTSSSGTMGTRRHA
jgi:hypothetical protein